ncbi:SET domain-containing protein [Lentinula raphanica]|nr:SET domain-containing protein [Lentinula raphanica]
MDDDVRWRNLLSWLKDHGMDTGECSLHVQRRQICEGTNYYGLFTTKRVFPSTNLFNIPKTALMNIKTLSSHYGSAVKALSATQLISLHLLLHRPRPDEDSLEPLFGPYISTLPRNFDYHPLSWITKSINTELLELLPPSTKQALHDLSSKFQNDLATVSLFVRDHCQLLEATPKRSSASLEWEESLKDDYLWAWLNVNTRCVYYQVKNPSSHPDNITLCPILDFANHSSHLPCMESPFSGKPNLRPDLYRDFPLISPSQTSVDTDTELYLKYGAHCNRVLFVEYGFVLPIDSIPETHRALEVNVDDIVDALLVDKGETGSWLKEILTLENYWRDWTMHYASGYAFASYRLVTALRLLAMFPSGSLPTASEDLLRPWKDVVLGNREKLANNYEDIFRSILRDSCTTILERATKALQHCKLNEQESIRILWKEERYVAERMLDLIEGGEVL